MSQASRGSDQPPRVHRRPLNQMQAASALEDIRFMLSRPEYMTALRPLPDGARESLRRLAEAVPHDDGTAVVLGQLQHAVELYRAGLRLLADLPQRK